MWLTCLRIPLSNNDKCLQQALDWEEVIKNELFLSYDAWWLFSVFSLSLPSLILKLQMLSVIRSEGMDALCRLSPEWLQHLDSMIILESILKKKSYKVFSSKIHISYTESLIRGSFLHLLSKCPFLRSSKVSYLIQPVVQPSIASRPFGDVILQTVMFSNWTGHRLIREGPFPD